jgi:outer membrane protein assembly factor BamD
MKRTAYVAAANRAQYAIQHYPQATAVEDAMAILVKAYDALGMAELRELRRPRASDQFPEQRLPQGRHAQGRRAVVAPLGPQLVTGVAP